MRRLGKSDPESIGPFSLVAKLGSGGMGSVYLGFRALDLVAIKIINGSLLDDAAIRQRFRGEIEALGRVRNQFVARLIEADADAENPWIATEFVNGPTLKEQLKHRSLVGEADWMILAQGLLHALQAVHGLEITHRDLKPSNVLLPESGPKLIDFGIAQLADQTSLTATGSVAGSPAWLAPEQLDGSPTTPAVDLFSLGSVLVYAATGRSPWGAENTLTPAQAFTRILEGRPDLSGLTKAQYGLVESLMRPRPESRATARDGLSYLLALPTEPEGAGFASLEPHLPPSRRRSVGRKLLDYFGFETQRLWP